MDYHRVLFDLVGLSARNGGQKEVFPARKRYFFAGFDGFFVQRGRARRSYLDATALVWNSRADRLVLSYLCPVVFMDGTTADGDPHRYHGSFSCDLCDR